MGASPALMSRLRFSTLSLKGTCVSSSSTLVSSLMRSNTCQVSCTGFSGQSVHRIDSVIGSVAVNCWSASKDSIAPTSRVEGSAASSGELEPHEASATVLNAAALRPTKLRRLVRGPGVGRVMRDSRCGSKMSISEEGPSPLPGARPARRCRAVDCDGRRWRHCRCPTSPEKERKVSEKAETRFRWIEGRDSGCFRQALSQSAWCPRYAVRGQGTSRIFAVTRTESF